MKLTKEKCSIDIRGTYFDHKTKMENRKRSIGEMDESQDEISELTKKIDLGARHKAKYDEMKDEIKISAQPRQG